MYFAGNPCDALSAHTVTISHTTCDKVPKQGAQSFQQQKLDILELNSRLLIVVVYQYGWSKYKKCLSY